MAFLSDHHWLITYNLSLTFESWYRWVHLAGLVLAIPGSIGLIALLGGSLFALLLSGGPHAILNVHDWKFILISPLLLLTLVGSTLVLVGRRGNNTQAVSNLF